MRVAEKVGIEDWGRIAGIVEGLLWTIKDGSNWVSFREDWGSIVLTWVCAVRDGVLNGFSAGGNFEGGRENIGVGVRGKYFSMKQQSELGRIDEDVGVVYQTYCVDLDAEQSPDL